MGRFCIFVNMKVIYEIVCKSTNKKYVGSALNHIKRKREHFYNLKNNKHCNKKLQNAFNKYGENCFEFNIIEIVDNENMLIEREQWYINKLNPIYNICRVAGSSLGLKRSNETKNKIRLANLGTKHPEWRNDIKSKSQGGDNHWTKKKKFSNGARNKMSNTKKEMYKDGYVSPVTKRIKQLNLDGSFIREWESATQVQKELGFNRKAIVQCLIKKSKKSNNFLWLYV